MKKLLLILLLCSLPAFAQSGCKKSSPSYSANITTATTTEIVAAQPGKRIYVWQFALENNHASTDDTVTFKSASTSLHGAGQLLKAGGGAWVQACSELAPFVTVAGEALNLTTSAAGTISGYIQYTVE